MRQDLTIKTASLSGTSELTVIAPIKRGLVPALDAVTYKTRVKRVLRTLHLGRSGAHEFELTRVLSDAVERVGRIHSVSIAVLEPEDQVKLAVTFDGAWEAYVRVIWQKVTRLLDLIFCHTEGYVLGWEHSYEDWGRWLRSRQVETSFLYATPGLTVDDARHLRMHERLDRRLHGAEGDLAVTRLHTPSAEDIASQGIFGDGSVAGLDPSNGGFGEPLTIVESGVAPFRHGMRSLAGLHRLADLFPPGSEDGPVLQRAAQELLPEFVRMLQDGNTYQTGVKRAMERYPEALRWLSRRLPLPPTRVPPPLRPREAPDNPAQVQGGILEGYEAAHGVLLLLGFSSSAGVAALLDALPVTPAVDNAALPAGSITHNIAFTVDGLRAAGLTETEVLAFPEEFVQGMERRAGLLGDVRINHPRRWRRPVLNWDLGVHAGDEPENADWPVEAPGLPPQVVSRPRVDLGAVHAMLQLRLVGAATRPEARERLMAALNRLVLQDGAGRPGVQPLSLQWMHRLIDDRGNTEEHFGFGDGKAQPVFDQAQAGRRFDNQVHVGEVLCGYANRVDARDDAVSAQTGVKPLLRDGSFLVLRKLRQDVEALDQAVAAGVNASRQQIDPPLTPDELLGKMMGRWPASHPKAGQPLVDGAPGQPDDFNFDEDLQGRQCPLHAHIRRANPRTTNPEAGSRPPRIVRRGMSYGPRADRKNPATLQQERGLVFMAYNASIGEQFEVVQRWLAGGNSSGSHSGFSDPFLGLPEPGRRRHFRFEHEGCTLRLPLDGSDRLHEHTRPIVRLEWGAYGFAPSLPALQALRQRAAAARPAMPWNATRGAGHIAALRDIETRQGQTAAQLAWKAALEDPEAAADFTTASIWAAIREHHGGVLRTPFGVLVGSKDLVQQVLEDRAQQLSVAGYWPRMTASFGGIYLGMDAGQTDRSYERESEACNRAILALDPAETFEQARASTHRVLQGMAARAAIEALEDAASRWDLTLEMRELIDPLLADFCEIWFGLTTDEGNFRRGGMRWDWQAGQPPYYPGHFLAPSRYFFQPQPGAEVAAYGRRHGEALRERMTLHLQVHAATTRAPVTRAVLDDPLAAADPKFAPRTLVGAIMGFVPTIDGNLKRILNEWLREGTLWSLRARAGGLDTQAVRALLRPALVSAMQLRAAPELLWRQVRQPHTLGREPGHEVRLDVQDIVVAGLISATQQSLQEGSADLDHAFGGNRRAAGPRPTHACPGMTPALAMMEGLLTALVESTLSLRPGPGPLSLSMDGQVQPELLKESLKALDAIQQAQFGGPSTGAQSSPPRTPLMAIGDSWLTTWWQPSLLESLDTKGYRVVKAFSSLGRRLADMASDPHLGQVRRYLRNLQAGAGNPRAIVLGGGGNDITYPSGDPESTPLYAMLVERATSAATALDPGQVTAFIDAGPDSLYEHYCKLLDAVTAEIDWPILIHGYDHPVPNGVATVPESPWLKPVFDARHITDLQLATEVMRLLIDRLNSMVLRLQNHYPGRVHHVKMSGILARQPDYANDLQKYWRNELHATRAGCDLLAVPLVERLVALKIAPAGVP